jgi:hypothetical protein
MSRWRKLDKQLCLSCMYNVIVAGFMALSGDPVNAVFFFAITSVLISGWRVKNDDIFSVALLMFGAWVLNSIVYFAFPAAVQLSYFVAFATHATITTLAYNYKQHWIASTGALMSIVALIGMVTSAKMPWRAVGNVLFLMQVFIFVATNMYLQYKTKINNKTDTYSGPDNLVVLELGAANGRMVATRIRKT